MDSGSKRPREEERIERGDGERQQKGGTSVHIIIEIMREEDKERERERERERVGERAK